MEDCHPHGYPGCHWCEFFLESVCQRNGETGLYLEAEPEVPILKDHRGWSGIFVCVPWEKDMGRQKSGRRSCVQRSNRCMETRRCSFQDGNLPDFRDLYYSYLYQMGVFPKKPKRIPYAVRSDIRRLEKRISQMEFLQKEEITTREELAAYRKPLEEQVLSLMKERRELYRKEPGGMRIQEINGELKELRKKIRLSQQIEKQSLEMEERLRQAKEQEEVQEMSGKQRREAEWNR